MKVFKIDIDLLDDLTGVDFNSFVEQPAHYRNFLAFNEERNKMRFFNDEEQTVTGVMISSNLSIPRYDQELGKFYVYFGAETIKKIIQKFFKGKNTDKVNINHNPLEVAENVYMIESYQVDGKVHMPDATIGSKIGDWVASYKVENPTIWKKVKRGEINGFSVEGFFSHLTTKIKTKNNNSKKQNMSKKTTSFKDLVEGFKAAFASEEKFAEVTTDTGLVLSYEGDLEVGTAILVVDAESGESTSAPEGVYALEDGRSLVLDASGIVAEIIEAAPEGEETPAEVEEAVAEAMAAILEMKKEVAALKLQVQKFGEQPKEEPKRKISQSEKIAALRLEAIKQAKK